MDRIRFELWKDGFGCILQRGRIGAEEGVRRLLPSFREEMKVASIRVGTTGSGQKWKESSAVSRAQLKADFKANSEVLSLSPAVARPQLAGSRHLCSVIWSPFPFLLFIFISFLFLVKFILENSPILLNRTEGTGDAFHAPSRARVPKASLDPDFAGGGPQQSNAQTWGDLIRLGLRGSLAECSSLAGLWRGEVWPVSGDECSERREYCLLHVSKGNGFLSWSKPLSHGHLWPFLLWISHSQTPLRVAWEEHLCQKNKSWIP